MIAVDSNVLIRFFVRDDNRQAALAHALISDNDIFVSKTVILETEWVLSHLYGFSLEKVIEVIRNLAGLPTVFLEDPLAVKSALDWSEKGFDLPDALHLASAGNATQFATFDRELAKRARHLAPLEITPL